MDAGKIWEVIILAVVQGIAEFLPISSSGHLVIVSAMLPGQTSLEENLAMNIALHLGTLGSILFVYRRDLLKMLANFQLLVAIVIATIPIVIVGFTLKDTLEAAFNSPAVAATGLLVTALFLWLCETLETSAVNDQSTPVDSPTWKQALAIGLFQAVAIMPGISRSGSTISGAVMSGVPRELATRFSFLIAIPAISGATLLHAVDMIRQPEQNSASPLLLLGALISFVVGIVALEGLLKIVRQKRLRWFAVYCLFASAVTWTWILTRG